uniref:Uncharacterized protein n=1 Tax=Opuntia streptacantha TaxID=393608 RepID=A0A7C9ALP9_OPUST
MASFSTMMIPTPQFLSTCRIAREETIVSLYLTLHRHVSTKKHLTLLLAEARGIYKNLTRFTRTYMAKSTTPVTTTLKELITNLTTCLHRLPIRTSCGNYFLSARAGPWGCKSLAWGAWTRVALQHTNMGAEILLV